jgi:DNA-binding response OmpR family regulator
MAMRILYVEDHVDTALTLKRLLKREGHDVQVAFSAAEAKALYADRPFDLLIIDVGLPDGHGGNLLKTLRRMADVKAVALTAHGMPNEVEEGLHDDGFDAYLVKPITLQQLLSTVSNLN